MSLYDHTFEISYTAWNSTQDEVISSEATALVIYKRVANVEFPYM
jgi:SHS2 domain-containing protein